MSSFCADNGLVLKQSITLFTKPRVGNRLTPADDGTDGAGG